jgi:hypothetical protein
MEVGRKTAGEEGMIRVESELIQVEFIGFSLLEIYSYFILI